MSRVRVYNYTFIPGAANAGKVVIPGRIDISNVLLITNITRNDVIYSFSDPDRGAFSVDYTWPTTGVSATTVAGQQTTDGYTTITLKYNTSTYAATDKLTIFVEELSSATRFLPQETYVDPANKLRISQPQSLIDTDFELGLQPTKWEFVQGHNNQPSFFVRPSDSPLSPITGGMGFTALNQTISVSGNIATVTLSGINVLPVAPGEGSYVYIVEASNGANFNTVRYSVLPNATTTSVQFYSSATNGSYTAAAIVISGVQPTQANFGSGAHAIIQVSNDISASGTPISANTPVQVLESLNETYADGTFFVINSNTSSRAFFFRVKSLFAFQSDLIKLGSTVVYGGNLYGSNVVSSNLKIFSVTSLGSETNGRTVLVNSRQPHGLYAGAPIFISNLVANGVNAQGSYYVASCPSEHQFVYYVPSQITAAAGTTGSTNANTVVGSNILRFASAPTSPIGSTVTGTNIPQGTFVVGKFDSDRAIRLNQPVTTQVNSATTITFSQVLSQSTTQIFVRPEGNQFHRSIDGGVQITPGSNIPYDYALRQTRRYFRYQSGKGIQFSTAALFKPIYDITRISVSGTTATITTDQDHGLQPGAIVTLSNIVANSVTDTNTYNSTFLVQPTPVITSKTFTVTLSASPTDTNPGGDGQVTVAKSVGSTTRLGLFDDGNGFFWEFDGQNFNAVRRNSTTVLRGQINILTGASLITGSNTRFTRQLSVNDKIFIRGQAYTVKTIINDNAISISPFYRAATPSTNLGNNGVPFSTIHTYTNGSGTPAAAASQTAWINSNAFTTTSTFNITTTPTGNASGAYQLTFSASVAAVAPGMIITGAGVPTGTYVSSVITATNAVTISNALTAAATNTAMTFGAVPSGVAANVIAVANSTGIAPGMLITGTGVPANTTVVSVPNGNSVYVTPAITTGVSNAVSLTFNAVSSTESILARIGTTQIAAGSTTVTLDAASSGITYAAPGMHIAGCPAFPSGTFITAYNSTTRVATLSSGASDAIGPASGVNITNTTVTSNICTTSANHGFSPGQMIYITGTAFGGLTTNRYYYVNTTPGANTFTLSTSPGGTNTVLSTATGTMVVNIACTFGYRASIFNTTNTTANDFHPISHQARDIRLNCTNTTATTNVITTSTTANLYEGMPVIFTGTTFGNVVAGTTYYIRQIVSATTFTISNAATNASDFTLTTSSGNMVMLISCIGVSLPNYIQTGGTIQQSTTRVYQEDVAVKITKVVETRVPSQNFNIDRLDGTGPSNYTINTARIQMVYIDYTWYGAGFIRWGLRANNGDVMYAHKMQHNNNEVQAYLRSGNLPGRFEVSNTPSFGRLTTAIATSGYTTASPGTIQVDNAYGFYVPSGLIANGDVVIDGEYFAYSGIAANASTSSPWFLGASAPTVATATCTVSGGRISTVTVTGAGSQYTSEPPILVSGGGGFGAQFKAILNNGTVSSIQIINEGFGYTSAPTLIIGPNQLTGAIRENSYVTAIGNVTTATTTVGSNLITVPSNANWKLGQIIAPPITQFNFITPLKVVGFNGTTQVYVDQPATVSASGTATLPLALRGTVEAAHNVVSASSPAAIVWQSRNDCTPSMQHYGVSSMMDGRFDTDKSYVFTTPRSTAAVVNTSSTSPLVSIRVAPSADNGFARNFGIRNVVNRMQLVLSSLGVYNQGAFLITVRLNATSTSFTPANWAANAVGSGSLAQVIYHNPGDQLIGGDVLIAFYASAAGGTNFTASTFELDKVKDLGHSVFAGDGVYPDGPDVLTITATNLSSTVPGVIFSRLSWTEAQA
jgi:hypothetical protein